MANLIPEAPEYEQFLTEIVAPPKTITGHLLKFHSSGFE